MRRGKQGHKLFVNAVTQLKDEEPVSAEEALSCQDKDVILAYIISRGYVRGLHIEFVED